MTLNNNISGFIKNLNGLNSDISQLGIIPSVFEVSELYDFSVNFFNILKSFSDTTNTPDVKSTRQLNSLISTFNYILRESQIEIKPAQKELKLSDVFFTKYSLDSSLEILNRMEREDESIEAANRLSDALRLSSSLIRKAISEINYKINEESIKKANEYTKMIY